MFTFVLYVNCDADLLYLCLYLDKYAQAYVLCLGRNTTIFFIPKFWYRKRLFLDSKCNHIYRCIYRISWCTVMYRTRRRKLIQWHVLRFIRIDIERHHIYRNSSPTHLKFNQSPACSTSFLMVQPWEVANKHCWHQSTALSSTLWMRRAGRICGQWSWSLRSFIQ